MQILVLHNNYPAQFRHLLPRLVKQGHDVRFISLENHGVKVKGVKHYLVKLADQDNNVDPDLSQHLINIHLSSLHKKVLIAEMMQTAFKKLKQAGFIPNLIIFHSGWGMGMHLKTIFPAARLAAFSEWWFSWDSHEQNFDRSSPYLPKQTNSSRLNERYTNLSQSLEICESDFIWTATEWQRSQFPFGLQPRINVFHEGVDTDFFSPNGDGINDTWQTAAIERYPNNEVWVYSRAGLLVFNKTNYLNNWDGNQNGNPLPEGSYYYLIDFNQDGQIDYKGWLFLTR